MHNRFIPREEPKTPRYIAVYTKVYMGVRWLKRMGPVGDPFCRREGTMKRVGPAPAFDRKQATPIVEERGEKRTGPENPGRDLFNGLLFECNQQTALYHNSGCRISSGSTLYPLHYLLVFTPPIASHRRCKHPRADIKRV